MKKGFSFPCKRRGWVALCFLTCYNPSHFNLLLFPLTNTLVDSASKNIKKGNWSDSTRFPLFSGGLRVWQCKEEIREIAEPNGEPIKQQQHSMWSPECCLGNIPFETPPVTNTVGRHFHFQSVQSGLRRKGNWEMFPRQCQIKRTGGCRESVSADGINQSLRFNALESKNFMSCHVYSTSGCTVCKGGVFFVSQSFKFHWCIYLNQNIETNKFHLK